jgi:predicted signal transduction protein with EAL and GGDEF domain
MSSSADHYSGTKPKLIGAWLFVGIPLLYGIVMTVKKALPLFGG